MKYWSLRQTYAGIFIPKSTPTTLPFINSFFAFVFTSKTKYKACPICYLMLMLTHSLECQATTTTIIFEY